MPFVGHIENKVTDADDVIRCMNDVIEYAGHGPTTGLNWQQRTERFNLAAETLGVAGSIVGATIGRAARQFINDVIDATDIPTGSSLNLGFLAGRYYGAPLSTARASQATYFDANGVLQIAANNVMRLDHDPVTGAPRGVLIEEARTNLFLHSSNFTQSSWSKVRVNLTQNAAIAPDGTTTATLMVEDTTETNTHQIAQSLSRPAGTASYPSIFVKKAPGGRRYIQVWTGNFVNQSQRSLVTFDFDTGTGVVSGAPLATAAVNIQQLADGWWRISAYTVSNGSGTVTLTVSLMSDATTTSYTGDGVSGVYIWGGQWEDGAFPTSYIPTTTAAATRAADQIFTNNRTWLSDAENSFVFDFDCPNLDNLSSGGGANSRRHLVGLQTVGSNNVLYIYLQPASGRVASLQVVVNNGGNVTTHTLGASNISEGRHRIAITLKSDGNARASVDGGAIRFSASVQSIPWSALDRFYFGAQINARFLNGHIRSATCLPHALSDSELQAASVMS